MSYIGPITQEIIDTCISELKKKDTREKISTNIVDPIVYEITSRFQAHVATYVFIQLVIVGLLIYVIFLLRRKNVTT